LASSTRNSSVNRAALMRHLKPKSMGIELSI